MSTDDPVAGHKKAASTAQGPHRPTTRHQHLAASGPRGLSTAVAYLRLNAVEAPEPQDLAPPELPLGVVNLLLAFSQLLIGHLILARPVACFLQALELARGDGGDDLQGAPDKGQKQGWP